MKFVIRHLSFCLLLATGSLALLLFVGCRAQVVPPDIVATATAPVQQAEPTLTPTMTPVPEPLALVVNDEGVSLAEYQAQLSQLEQADQELGIERTPEERQQMVLDELIVQTLLAQAAQREGFRADEAVVQSRLDQLVNQPGGAAAFSDWTSRMGYTPESIRSALQRSIESAWQRDRILSSVPERVEQVKARQILVRFLETAQNLYRQLEAGADFATLALQYDALTGGDLGWFPRGYLTQPDVEEAAFNLQEGDYSEIIETSFGFHIVQVIERDDNHPLSPDARLIYQQKAFVAWLDSERNSAKIEILVP
jgi:peptidyl-prolyl cis-trans isomerase C